MLQDASSKQTPARTKDGSACGASAHADSITLLIVFNRKSAASTPPCVTRENDSLIFNPISYSMPRFLASATAAVLEWTWSFS